MTLTIVPKATPIAILPKAQAAGGDGINFIIEGGWDTKADLDIVVGALSGTSLTALAYQSSDPSTAKIGGVDLGVDNRSGVGNAVGETDEATKLDFSAVAPGVDRLAVFFVIYDPSGVDFSSVKDVFIAVKTAQGTELFRLNNTDAALHRDTVFYAGDFVLRNGAWEFVGRDIFLNGLGNGADALNGIVGLDFGSPKFLVA